MLLFIPKFGIMLGPELEYKRNTEIFKDRKGIGAQSSRAQKAGVRFSRSSETAREVSGDFMTEEPDLDLDLGSHVS